MNIKIYSEIKVFTCSVCYHFSSVLSFIYVWLIRRKKYILLFYLQWWTWNIEISEIPILEAGICSLLMILGFVKPLTFVKAPGISVYNNSCVFVIYLLIYLLMQDIVKVNDTLMGKSHHVIEVVVCTLIPQPNIYCILVRLPRWKRTLNVI